MIFQDRCLRYMRFSIFSLFRDTCRFTIEGLVITLSFLIVLLYMIITHLVRLLLSQDSTENLSRMLNNPFSPRGALPSLSRGQEVIYLISRGQDT